MNTPEHFESSNSFSLYIHLCAIRDRQRLIDCYAHLDDEESKNIVAEARTEISAMRSRRRTLKRRASC